MRVSRPLASYFTYTLGNNLYVPFTGRSNARTLPETRGPKFLLGAPIVAALCRVRDEENGTQQWKHWCLYLDTQETPQKLPASMDLVSELQPISAGDKRCPSIEDLATEVQQKLKGEHSFKSIVIAGEGEPMLRLDDVLGFVSTLKSAIGESQIPLPEIRLTTNGLVDSPAVVAESLIQAGVSTVSVALMTSDPVQYDELMDPVEENAHRRLCSFVKEAVKVGLVVETTGVDRPEVDKERAEQLSRSLHVPSSMRWRPYFP